MPTPFESAQLNLQLFDLRREPVLREARAWFTGEFNPETFGEFLTIVRGERNAAFRMVLGYWDMAASMVTNGAIDAEAFRAAHSEIVATFAKVHPFIDELRKVSGESEFCEHIENVVMADPEAESKMKRRREMLKAAAKARREVSSKT